MKSLPAVLKRVALLAGLSLATLAFTGCESMSVGFGVSGHNSSGMSYGFGTSTGPYGTHSYSSIGYSSGGYYGRPPYGRW